MLDGQTLIIDIGKSNAKLLLIDEAGEVQFQRVKTNQSVQASDYTALDIEGIQSWLLDSLPAVPMRRQIRHIGITTHGAAFCGVNAKGLAIPAIDYEWDGYGAWRDRYQGVVDPFEETGSPHLPQGLNAGLQLYWLKNAHPELWGQVDCWMPYPQFWAWWLTGQAATEVSSLGCHTHLWNPHANEFSHWAQREELVSSFAPVRPAWDSLGKIRASLSDQLGLNEDCVVHVGLHDSNACLARHMKAHPQAPVVSTGTWTVVMTPGLDHELPLMDPRQEQFFNISIERKPVPTARFMGGREFHHLCHGADPALATVSTLDTILQAGWQVLPHLDPESGELYGSVATLMKEGQIMGNQPALLPIHLRPTLASMYCAFMTAHLLQNLYARMAIPMPKEYIVEGPLSTNAIYLQALSALLDKGTVLRPLDEVEGTARGAWLSTRWNTNAHHRSHYEKTPTLTLALSSQIQEHYQAWLQLSVTSHHPYQVA